MTVKGNHPLAEIIARKLFCIESVPVAEQGKMVNRAIKAAVAYHEAEINRKDEALRLMLAGAHDADRAGEFSDLLNAGNKAQIEKLKQNTHKGGFDNIALDYAWKRIEEEMKELSTALCLIPLTGSGYLKALKNIRHESADVANFAHMIIYKCDQLITEAVHARGGK